MADNSISLKQARRLTLNAQGFVSTGRERNTGWNRLQSTLEKTQLLQIDSVNALCRSHYLPLFSRTGLYRQAMLDQRTLAATNRSVFEYWGHEASLLPVDMHPLFRWRMAEAKQGKGIYKGLATFATDNPTYIKKIYKRVRDEGPCTAGQLAEEKSTAGWWQWSKSKMALEFLFCTGRITTSHRHNFQRFYDIAERVIPSEVLNSRSLKPKEAHKALLMRASKAHGVGTEPDLRDYFRLSAADSKAALAELIEDKQLDAVSVEGWPVEAYLSKGMVIGKQVRCSAVLSPFDPVVWFRDRAQRLFDFHYRLEIYTPLKKRKYGYYVLPVLHNEKLVGRIDIKSERKTNTLLVLALFAESEKHYPALAQALLSQLPLLMQFLKLEKISIAEQTTWRPGEQADSKVREILRSHIQQAL